MSWLHPRVTVSSNGASGSALRSAPSGSSRALIISHALVLAQSVLYGQHGHDAPPALDGEDAPPLALTLVTNGHGGFSATDSTGELRAAISPNEELFNRAIGGNGEDGGIGGNGTDGCPGEDGVDATQYRNGTSGERGGAGECSFSFHAVNWLHKGLRSSNIVFLSPAAKQPDLAAPFVLGFHLSRPGELAQLTTKPPFDAAQDIYRHPYAQSSLADGTYRKSYDLYSLGILLIEISCWQRIHSFLGMEDLATTTPSALSRIQRQLLDNPQYLQEVASTFGDTFRSIVKTCLQADEIEKAVYDGETESAIAIRLQRTSEDIVRKLQAIQKAVSLV